MDTKTTTQQTPAKATTKATTRKAPTKQASNKANATKPAQAGKKVFVPGNRPTAGGLLFAYTWACIQVVSKAPKAKQGKLANLLHGATALRHHGIDGTRKMVANDDGSMTYDSGFFALGQFNKSDPKRSKVDPETGKAFLQYLQTGKDCVIGAWKPTAKPLAVIEY